MRRSKFISVLVLSLFLFAFFGFASFAADEDFDVAQYKSHKIFVSHNQTMFNGFRVMTSTVTGTDFKIVKNESDNYATLYYKGSGYVDVTIMPNIEKAVAVKVERFIFDNMPQGSTIVNLPDPMLSMEVFEASGVVGEPVINGSVGRQSDDPWVSNPVFVSPNGIVHLQPLEAGDYWLELSTVHQWQLKTPARLLFSVDANGQVTGLEDYQQANRPQVDVFIENKNGNIRYPYKAGFNVHTLGTGSLKGTWVGAYWSKEGSPIAFSELKEGVYNYYFTAKQEVSSSTETTYSGKLVISNGTYDFDFPSYLPYKLRVVQSDLYEKLGKPESKNKLDPTNILETQQMILQQDPVLYFNDLNVTLHFPSRYGQKDEHVILQTINRDNLGIKFKNLGSRFETQLVSQTYEILMTNNSNVSEYEVELPIDLSMATNPNRISAYGYSPDVNKWINLGGTLTQNQTSIRFKPQDFQVLVLAEADPRFTDTQKHKWALPAISSLAARGIIEGYENGAFKPGNYIKTSEFLKLVINSCGLSGDSSKVFPSTKNKWYMQFVSRAIDLGLVQTVNGDINVEVDITRREMAHILYQIIRRHTYLEPQYNPIVFEDLKDEPVDSLVKIELVQRYGLMKGQIDGFYPNAPASRAEASQVIFNLLEFIGQTK